MSVTTDIGAKFLGKGWESTAATFAVTNPATGEEIAQIADCGEAEARRAVDLAAETFETWRHTTAFERSALLERWADLMIEHQEELAAAMTNEMGKAIKESRGEVAYAASFVKWYAEEAKRIAGQTVQSQFSHKRLLALKQPVGPVHAVTPGTSRWLWPRARRARHWRQAAPSSSNRPSRVR